MEKTFLLLIAIVVLLNTTWAQKGSYLKGEGRVVTKELKLDKFDAIGLAVVGKVYISKGNTQKVVVKGQANMIANLKTNVKDGEWDIKFDRKAKNYESFVFEITLPDVSGLAIAGSGDIVGQDDFNGLDRLKLAIAGAGNIEFSGSAQNVTVAIAGSGSVDVKDLKAETCKVNISGAGDCRIEVEDQLKVSIAGSGDVRYKGSPKVSTSIAGSGNVRQM